MHRTVTYKNEKLALVRTWIALLLLLLLLLLFSVVGTCGLHVD